MSGIHAYVIMHRVVLFDGLLLYCTYFSIMLTTKSVPLKSILHYFTNKIISAKYIVLSNIICVVSDNLLRICIQETLLISKKIIVVFFMSKSDII